MLISLSNSFIWFCKFAWQKQDDTETLTSVATLFLYWTDDYLIWNDIEQIEFYNQFKVQIPKSSLWAPEILVWNSADETEMIKIKNDTLLTVSSEGEVKAKISYVFHTECEMKLWRYSWHFINALLLIS